MTSVRQMFAATPGRQGFAMEFLAALLGPGLLYSTNILNSRPETFNQQATGLGAVNTYKLNAEPPAQAKTMAAGNKI